MGVAVLLDIKSCVSILCLNVHTLHRKSNILAETLNTETTDLAP